MTKPYGLGRRAIIRAGIVLTVAVFTLGACNTMKGVGRDMKNAGDWISEEAEEAKN